MDTVESAIQLAVPGKVLTRRNPRQNTVVNVIWRALVLVAGLTMVCLGVLLLVLPGPGWACILLGLAILATEFTWANRLMAPIRRRVQAEASRVRRMSRRRQLAVACCGIMVVLAAAALGAWFVMQSGWTWPW